MEEPIIHVDNLSKTFRLPNERATSLKSMVINFWRRKRGYQDQKALAGVSFDIKPGEFFGIVGRNGSGKSTLLKILAGIYPPTGGSVRVNGRLTPFIELGVGFNPELSGRDNVYLSGSLLGFNRKDMDKMYDEIVEFAELKKFMDQKLKNYSSGMQVRLAFSIAIRARSDILLIDEVLAVGDLDFQKKCYNYFFDLKRQGRTIVFVTHDMGAIRQFCTRAIMINDGKLIGEGKPDDIAHMYETINLRQAEKRMEAGARTAPKRRSGSGEATIIKAETFNPINGRTQNTFDAKEKIGVRLDFRAKTDIAEPVVGFIFQNQDDLVVFATNNQMADSDTKPLKSGETLKVETVVDNVFTDGEYTITVAIESSDLQTVYDRVEYLHHFMIGGHRLPHALAHPAHQMRLSYSQKG